MHIRLLFALVMAVALAAAPGAALAHEGLPGEIPPGVHDQAHALMGDMMMHMMEMGMSEADMAMMMADMEMMAAELPPGTLIALLRLMNRADHASMMELHQFMHSGEMEARSPGEMLAAAQRIVRR